MESNKSSGVLGRVVDFSLDLICAIDKEGQIYQINDICKQILGYEREELENKNFFSFIHPKHYEATRSFAKDIFKKAKKSYFENCYLSKTGHEVHLQWSTVWSEEDELYFCIGRDITEQKRVTQQLREKDELYRSLIEYGADMLGLLDATGTYLYVSESTKNVLGYLPSQLLGQNALSLIHPDDLEKVQEGLSQINTGNYLQILEFRFKAEDGNWRWIETKASNQLNNPAIKGIAISSRDITEQKLNRLQLQESEQRFRSLFENNPNLVYYQNREGKILDANPAFLTAFGLSKGGFVGYSIFDFLPSDVKSYTYQKHLEAFDGKLVSYDLETEIIGFDHKGRRNFSITKVPVTINDTVVGIYSILKDTTDIIQSQKTIQQQANKLNTIFESITNAFFVLDKNRNFNYINKEAERLLQLNRKDCLGKDILTFFPEENTGGFIPYYQQAITTGETVYYKTFIQKADVWLEVAMYPSEEGVSVYFTDITDRVKTEQELVKLSLVASKITNGVNIMDATGHIEWVNEGFAVLTGYTLEEVVGKTPGEFLYGPETSLETVNYIREHLVKGMAVSAEMLDYHKSGEKIWLAVNITPILDTTGKVNRFISILTDITDKKEAEQELKQLSLVANKISNGVTIMNASGCIEWVNDGFTTLTGYNKSEVMGRRPQDFLHGPETNLNSVRLIGERLSNALPVSVEMLDYQKSGSRIWLAVDITPVLDDAGKVVNFISIQTDITERIRFREELKKLSLVASKTTNSVIIMDAYGRIEWVNKAFCTFSGYEMADVLGQVPGELLAGPDSDAAQIQELQDKLKMGLPVSMELLNYIKSGEKKWVLVEITPVKDKNGQVLRLIAIQTDITERKQAEVQQMKMTQDLYKQNRDLQQFTYIVSHNLRAPVANALGLTNLMGRVDKHDIAFDKALLNLKKSIMQLDCTLKDVNTILTARNHKPESALLNVKEVCQQAEEALQDQLIACSGNIHYRFTGNLFIQADKAYLYSVFYNMLSNAIKYRSADRALDVVVTGSSTPENTIVLSVADNGLGMDLKKVGKEMFKLYSRFHPDINGRGIGLFLVKSHVEAMGGSIEVESELNVGTKFIISLN
ncbi:PAS domain S-box protein [Pontibacter qinzhouensis]|uniref:histidine kinase n=1 Tax=Pontibacter qinzhouensis TaxID=2603253 RepID=A0A5C8KB77_9BACT|nr:PAS domain-containing sensor histidine kinase [Pontibacter qinzhouensis]TXK48903.1 PAS domain S-box protein [Pontibacter qinzhouensis]